MNVRRIEQGKEMESGGLGREYGFRSERTSLKSLSWSKGLNGVRDEANRDPREECPRWREWQV